MTQEDTIAEELKAVKEKIAQLEEKNMKHSDYIIDLLKENDGLKTRLIEMEKKGSDCERLKRNLEQLRGEIKEVKHQQSIFKKKHELLEGLKKSLNRILVPTQKISELEQQVVEIRDQNGFLEEEIASTHSRCRRNEEKIPELQHHLRDLEHHLVLLDRKFSDAPHDFSSPILFDAVLNIAQAPDVRKPLDVCIYNAPGSSPFDKRSCVLNPPVAGHYALITRLGHYGNGEIKVYLGLEGLEKADYLGLTHEDNDVLNSFKVWKLRQGQKVWVEAHRTKGNCKIGFCSFSGWLLSTES